MGVGVAVVAGAPPAAPSVKLILVWFALFLFGFLLETAKSCCLLFRCLPIYCETTLSIELALFMTNFILMRLRFHSSAHFCSLVFLIHDPNITLIIYQTYIHGLHILVAMP